MELATSCYEHACGKFPNNLELMMGLFNCYVREYSFVKQQQVCVFRSLNLFLNYRNFMGICFYEDKLIIGVTYSGFYFLPDSNQNV